MDRAIRGVSALLLLVGTALHAGCGNSASGLTSSSVAESGMANDNPMARPTHVAWTAARAQRCGFNFDAGKLRASYIAYETRQGAAGEQLGKIQTTYDVTFKATAARVSEDADYCTDKKSADIKTNLGRHLAGDYAPNFPKTQTVENVCGFFGCSPPTDPNEKFDAKKMYGDLDRKQGRQGW